MVISVYEKLQMKRLKEKDIVIESIYINPLRPNGYPYIRTTDGKVLNNIRNFPLKEKRYFHNNEFIYKDDKFDDEILYNIETFEDENEIITCPNCGNEGKVIDLMDGCPYCRSVFNFGISDKIIGKRKIVKGIDLWFYFKLYLLWLPLEFFIMGILCSVFVEEASLVLLLGNIILFLILIIIIRKHKLKEKLKYEYYKGIEWKSSKNERNFYNNLYLELLIDLFETKDLIDFEIVNYEKINFISDNEIIIYCLIRKIFYTDKIIVTNSTYEIKLNYNDRKIDVNDNNYKLVKCLGCGSSIDVSADKCNYCHRINDTNNEWIIESIKKTELKSKNN